MRWMAFLLAIFAIGSTRATWAAQDPAPWESLLARAEKENLSSKKAWLRLVHYQKKFFGGWESQADGPTFFLAPDGKINPHSELQATLKSFFDQGSYESPKQHPQCQFRGRYLWLKKNLPFSDQEVRPVSCPAFERFKNNIGVKSATLVFSSYFLNNPASAFGHSLLRLNKTPVGQVQDRYELLDYGINYSAVVTTGNPVAYAVMGLMGGFQGTFTSVPYYYKVREYNDYESRDLWEYDLNLSQEKLDSLVAHLWELGSTYFDYWYLTENCSYHMLTVLEAADPELELVSKLHRVVIPADTIKAVMSSPRLVAKVRYRPSARVQFRKRIEQLNRVQKDHLHEVIRWSQSKESSPLVLSGTLPEKIQVLDAAMDYLDYRFGRKLLVEQSSASEWKQRLLIERSKLSAPSEALQIPAPEHEMPHLGHDSSRVGVEFGHTLERGDLMRFQYRYALHDLMDPTLGYPKSSQIEFFNAKVRYGFDSKEVSLDEIALFRVTSLSPFTEFEPDYSWRAELGMRRVQDRSCHYCLAGNAKVGGGFLFQLDSGGKYSLIPMIDLELLGSGKFSPFFLRGVLGPNMTFKIRFNQRIQTALSAGYLHSFPSFRPRGYFWGAETRFGLTRNSSFNLRADRQTIVTEFSGGLNYYF